MQFATTTEEDQVIVIQVDDPTQITLNPTLSSS